MTTPARRFFAADLSQLLPADIIDPLSYETIRTAHINQVVSLLDGYNVQMLESDPAIKILEVGAYRELLLRALVNDKCRAILLAYAQGDNLDHLGALMATARRQIGVDGSNNPIYQSDDEYRAEIELAPEAFSIAGPEGAYVYFALRSDASIVDAAALNPSPGRIDIVLLSRNGNGHASDAAISAAFNALSPKTTRPLTDDVHVQSAAIVNTSIVMNIQVNQGPDPALIQTNALAAVAAYVTARRKIGMELRVDGLIGAARTAGDIEHVTVSSPSADVNPGAYGAVYVTSTTITVEVLT